MVICQLVWVAVVLTAATGQQPASSTAAQADEVAFGPDGCVVLSRSGAGTCVFDTECDGHDLSEFEFAFNCEDENGLQGNTIRHSYGSGGFDVRETFDTDVKCDKCSLPSPPPPKEATASPAVQQQTTAAPRLVASLDAGAAAKANVVAAVATATSTRTNSSAVLLKGSVDKKPDLPKATRKDVERYGPSNCVSVYKDQDGHCVMETDCTQDAVAEYEFAFLCEETDGTHTQHVFGKGSFDAKENFNTLVECRRCLAFKPDSPKPKQQDNDALLKDEVSSLKDMITGLRGRMSALTATIQRISGRMFPETQTPAGMTPAMQAALMNQKVTVVREKLRGHKVPSTQGARTSRRAMHEVLDATDAEDQQGNEEDQDSGRIRGDEQSDFAEESSDDAVTDESPGEVLDRADDDVAVVESVQPTTQEQVAPQAAQQQDVEQEEEEEDAPPEDGNS